jgi:hypothetical protein
MHKTVLLDPRTPQYRGEIERLDGLKILKCLRKGANSAKKSAFILSRGFSGPSKRRTIWHGQIAMIFEAKIQF